jgi:hypothetical protein
MMAGYDRYFSTLSIGEWHTRILKQDNMLYAGFIKVRPRWRRRQWWWRLVVVAGLAMLALSERAEVIVLGRVMSMAHASQSKPWRC